MENKCSLLVIAVLILSFTDILATEITNKSYSKAAIVSISRDMNELKNRHQSFNKIMEFHKTKNSSEKTNFDEKTNKILKFIQNKNVLKHNI